ncbi:Spy/CpxP family protein refolding chaperone [Vacuolonema iberomarrocanum]|uniref:Spy/CpxP family protein refolding chaperone n=1 Tax=Vacuolonema iberomarrocanum TaxID=3454632 RepID=UPI001A0BB0BD|nr:Spy/CpxP family protein refolding chaperone [filamentous cyanobacterium LEGE 07170]
MKRQWTLLAIAGGLAALTLAIAPLSSMAQSAEGGRGLRGEGRGRVIEQLDLTEQQQAELQQIRAAHQAEVSAILTDAQQDAIQTGIEAGEPMPALLRSIDLSQEQRDNLQALRETHRQQGREVLTPEQQAQIDELQANRGDRGDRSGRGWEILEELDLTNEQRAELNQIREASREEMATVLNDEQQAAFRSGLAAGEPIPELLRSLDLSDDQRATLRTIVEDGLAEARDVLTPEQQAQIDELRESRRGRRGGMQ